MSGARIVGGPIKGDHSYEMPFTVGDWYRLNGCEAFSGLFMSSVMLGSLLNRFVWIILKPSQKKTTKKFQS